MTGRLLTGAEAADWLGVSIRTLEDWRLRGGGPVYRKLGRKLVRYSPAELEAFADAGTMTNTGGGRPMD